MKIEEIILHFFIFTVLVVIGILTIQVWHYLNSKPLGLQTILDDLAKESFTVFGLALVLNWTTRINPGLEFNYYFAMFIVKINMFFTFASLEQIVTFFIIRYFLVFHFPYINNVDETKVKTVLRIVEFGFTFICTLIEDCSQTFRFQHLTNPTQAPKIETTAPLLLKSMFFLTIGIVSFVQMKILYFKYKSPPVPNENDNYNFKVISLACFISVFIIFAFTVTNFLTSFIMAKLVRNLCSYLLILFALSMIIVSNDNLYAHVKRNFKGSVSNQASSSGLNQEDLHFNKLQQPNEES